MWVVSGCFFLEGSGGTFLVLFFSSLFFLLSQNTKFGNVRDDKKLLKLHKLHN